MKQDGLIALMYAVVAVLMLLAFLSSGMHWVPVTGGVLASLAVGLLSLVFRKSYREYKLHTFTSVRKGTGR